MTEPDTPDPSSPSGDPWWKPLAPEHPPSPSEPIGEGWTSRSPDRADPQTTDQPAAPAPSAEPLARDATPVIPAPSAPPTPEPVVPAAVEPVIPDLRPVLVDIEDVEDDEPLAKEPPSEGSRRTRAVVEWVAVIVGALLVALVVKTFLFQAFYIPSESMEPTLEKGDRVLVNKLSYDLHDVHRGDVIVFELDADEIGADGIKDLIKRVIGLPGDTIETRDGKVYINDAELDEPYLPDGTLTGDPTVGTNPEIPRQVVPEGTVFVLGDNRDNSADSRYANRGPIPIDHIVGRAFVLVWPPQDVSGL